MERWLEEFAATAFRRSAETAHDLKTPLNIAILNLELLRMHARSLTGGEDDSKLADYAAAVESEIRRLGRIFDAFFVYSTPPPAAGDPELIRFRPIVQQQAAALGVRFEPGAGEDRVKAHENRLRDLVSNFLAGCSRLVNEAGGFRCLEEPASGEYRVVVEGRGPGSTFEWSKVFKFYYSDSAGNPDLSLATARLIAETYGGSVTAFEAADSVRIVLALPTGEQ